MTVCFCFNPKLPNARGFVLIRNNGYILLLCVCLFSLELWKCPIPVFPKSLLFLIETIMTMCHNLLSSTRGFDVWAKLSNKEMTENPSIKAQALLQIPKANALKTSKRLFVSKCFQALKSSRLVFITLADLTRWLTYLCRKCRLRRSGLYWLPVFFMLHSFLTCPFVLTAMHGWHLFYMSDRSKTTYPFYIGDDSRSGSD